MSDHRETKPGRQLYPVSIPLPDIVLEGELTVPAHARGVVVILDEERHKTGCRDIAHILNTHDFATLITGLLGAEDRRGGMAHTLTADIPKLSERLQHVTEWVRNLQETRGFTAGFVAFSGDAASCVIEAARHQDTAGAIVSCDGRPDLAGDMLRRLEKPLLLVVCGHDPDTLAINRDVLDTVGGPHELHIVANADSVFSTAAALNETAQAAAAWFDKYLRQAA